MPAEYEGLVERRAEEGRRLSGLEKEMFGWDHADAAAMLAKQWNLPEEFITLIAQHTHLSELLAGGETQRGAACVALASLLPSCSEESWSEHSQFVEGYQHLTSQCESELERLFEQVDEATIEFAPVLKLPVPKVALVEYLRKECGAAE